MGQVASIRELAEAGRRGLALARLEDMVAMVVTRLDRGLIDESRALEILELAGTTDELTRGTAAERRRGCSAPGATFRFLP
jgi:hypothetical protein